MVAKQTRKSSRLPEIGQVWLPDMDSNHDKQIQKLLCYHYTIRQERQQRNPFAIPVKQA